MDPVTLQAIAEKYHLEGESLRAFAQAVGFVVIGQMDLALQFVQIFPIGHPVHEAFMEAAGAELVKEPKK